MAILEFTTNNFLGKGSRKKRSNCSQNIALETDHWRRLFSDAVDVVYGPKGQGKALFTRCLLDGKPSFLIGEF